jgi:hypothetical protein
VDTLAGQVLMVNRDTPVSVDGQAHQVLTGLVDTLAGQVLMVNRDTPVSVDGQAHQVLMAHLVTQVSVDGLVLLVTRV